MSAFSYFTECFTKKYMDFNGRARRSEYWYFVLFSAIFSMVASVVDGITGYPILATVYGLVALIPGIAVAVRRLHDTDKSGWWYLLVFTIIGIIPLIYFFVTDSTPGTNQYGHNPKGIGSDEPIDHLITDEV